jgi:predicted phosphoribosyltransferase/dienelactone hydrolase
MDGTVTAFRDRGEAGRRLAERLASLVRSPAVVAGIPRGGLLVAEPIAERLAAPLTVLYARKLAAPLAPELAFGALDEDGEAVVDPRTVAALGLGPAEVERIKARVRDEIQRRMALYGTPPLAHFLPAAEVVLVDDGLATGLTMQAALAYARRHGARTVTVAVPCASAEAAERFRREADRFVSLVVDEAFVAVGAYYVDFSPVSDDEVRAVLARATRGPAEAGGGVLRLSFRNARGDLLAGELLAPAGRAPWPAVVVAHRRDGHRREPWPRAVGDALRAAGIAALLFDFTGHGQSEGSAAALTPDREADDLRAALDLARALDEVDPGRVGLAGQEMGAATALRVAADDGRVRALALQAVERSRVGEIRAVKAPALVLVEAGDRAAEATAVALLARLAAGSRLAVLRTAAPEGVAEAAARIREWFGEQLT